VQFSFLTREFPHVTCFLGESNDSRRRVAESGLQKVLVSSKEIVRKWDEPDRFKIRVHSAPLAKPRRSFAKIPNPAVYNEDGAHNSRLKI